MKDTFNSLYAHSASKTHFVADIEKERFMRSLGVLHLSIAHLRKAFIAIDRLVILRDKRDFGLYATVGAHSAVSYLFTPCCLLVGPTITATDRIIHESFFCKKLLFTCGEYKFGSTIPAYKRSVLVHLCFPRFVFWHAQLTWSLSPHPPAGSLAPRALPPHYCFSQVFLIR